MEQLRIFIRSLIDETISDELKHFLKKVIKKSSFFLSETKV